MLGHHHAALPKELIEEGAQYYCSVLLEIVAPGGYDHATQAGFARRRADMVGRGRYFEPPSLYSIQTSDPIERWLNSKALQEFAIAA